MSRVLVQKWDFRFVDFYSASKSALDKVVKQCVMKFINGM